MQEEIYLGDALYARYDGTVIWLRAEREEGDQVVALEPATFAAFCDWAIQRGLL